MTEQPDAVDRLGPVDLLVIEFPRGRLSAEGFATLVDLVDRDVLRVLDLEFVTRPEDGPPRLVAIEDAVSEEAELHYLNGASTDLLDDDDVLEVGTHIEPGSLGCVVVVEHSWALGLSDALEASGAHLLRSSRVSPEDLVAALTD